MATLIANQITLGARLSWRLSSFPCNSQTIANGISASSMSFGCSGCAGAATLPLYCTDFDTVVDWSSGRGSQTILTSGTQVTYRFSDAAWIYYSSWSLVSRASIDVRNDTGAINNAPIADMIPIIYWHRAYNHTLKIPVMDADGDIVKCRFAVSSTSSTDGLDECASVCNRFPEGILHERSCTLTYTADSIHSDGYRAVAVQVEDFAHSDPNTVLSSISLQFLVYMHAPSTSSAGLPTFIAPTPNSDTVLVYEEGQQKSINITAKGKHSFGSIDTISPIGLIKSGESIWSNTGDYFITASLTWTPSFASTTDSKAHVICFAAKDSFSQSSEIRCVHLQDTTIAGSSIGDNCTVDAHCVTTNSECSGSTEGSTCICKDGYVVSHSGKVCEQETDLGGYCSVDETCITDNSQCSGSDDDSVCVCKPDYVISESGIACEGETGLGGYCTVNATCTTDNSQCSGSDDERVCACQPGYIESKSGMTCEAEMGLGGNCTVDETCITDDSHCSGSDDEGVCACVTGFVESKSGVLCEKETDLGGYCSVDETCITDNSQCSGSDDDSVCVCRPDYVISESGIACEAETGLGGYCTVNATCTTDNSQCSGSDDESVCACEPGYIESKSGMTCEAEMGLGGNCTVDETCITDDSHCSGSDDEGVCACVTGFVESKSGVLCEKETNLGGYCSVDETCITDNSQCSGSDDDNVCVCRPDYVISESGIACEAETGLGGYCTVNATCTTDNSQCSGSDDERVCACEPGYIESKSGMTCEAEMGLGGNCTVDKTCITDDSHCSGSDDEGVCACVIGFVESKSGVLCEKETDLGGYCSVDETCITDNSQCSGSDDDSVCVCRPDYVISESGIACEAETGLGGYCTVNATCTTDNSQCSESDDERVCACEPGYIESKSGMTCEAEMGLGGNCTVDETCITDDSHCSGSDDEGVCACVTGFVESKSGVLCEKVTGIGGSCTVSATCITENSQCSFSNEVSTCICSDGFVTSYSETECEQETIIGGNCTVDATCTTQHSQCSGSTAGSTCICKTGFTISQSGTLCEKAPRGGKCGPLLHCRTPGAACVNGVCTCAKTGVYSKIFDVCDTMDLFEYDTADDERFPVVQSNTAAISFAAGIPIFSLQHTTVFVSSNGIVSFDYMFTNPTPSRDLSVYSTRSLLAVHFSNIKGGTVFYRSYDVFTANNDLNKEEVLLTEQLVNKYGQIDNFKAKFILFVTWRNVTSYTLITEDTDSQTATFQLVLITDGVDTFVMYIYGHNQMDWSFKMAADVWIGFTSDGQHYDTHVHSYTKFTSRMDKFAEFQGVKGLLFYRLTIAGSTRPNSAILCIDWFNQNKHRQADMAVEAAKLLYCPCDIDRLRLDPWYKQFSQEDQSDDVECVIIHDSAKYGSHGKTCCYNTTTGFWINERPHAGTYLEYHPDVDAPNYQRHDADIKKVCCFQSSYCQLFYQLKSVGKCYNQTWFQFASTWGDPHIRTLDGLNYTFNGLGEFTLIQSDEITVQARTGRAVLDDGRVSNDATVFTAFAAADQSGASFHVELDENEDGLIIYGNKAELTNKYRKKKSFEHRWDSKDLVLKRHLNTLIVLFTTSDVALEISIGVRLLKMKTMLPNNLKNKTNGLLGNFDEDPTNDISSPAGQQPQTKINESVAYEYGMLWEVADSILEYGKGKSHADYHYPSFKPRFLDEVLEDKLQEAVDVCGSMEQQACIFDYVFTQSSSLAGDTLETDKAAVEARAELESVTPSLTGCEETFVTVGEVLACTVSYNDDEGVTIEFLENDVGAVYNQSTRTVQYTVTSAEPPNLQVIAVKKNQKKEKKSPPVQIPIRMCSGCTHRGTCSKTKVRKDKRETATIKYAACDCFPEYEGDDCEKDFDGCAANPCSLGRACTDLSPEEHESTGVAYVCDDCPTGYEDDGTQCEDIDECGIGTDDCEHNCTNTDGGYICTCLDGFRPTPSNISLCEDINECDEAKHDCRHNCENIRGGYACSCKNGYTLDDAANECISDFDPDATPCDALGLNCTFTHGCEVDDNATASCFCEDGYQLSDDDTECLDINECSGQLCDMTCDNFDGDFRCGCPAGYALENVITCRECEPGFWGDECANECDCSAGGTLECNPVHGCICKDGWTEVQCNVDINECELDPNICGDVRKECINVNGSHYCQCLEGYEEYREGCRDVNECTDPTKHSCEQSCTNTIGGYVCGCDDGFTKSGQFTCSDINECESRRTGCEHQCENYPGLYRCSCYYGFILNEDRRTCKNDSTVNPCKGYTDLTCSQICVVDNTDVAECKCKAGFELGKDGTSCFDIDECKTGQPCSDGAICDNIPGAYICRCPLGSQLENDERTCTECDDYHYGENCGEVCSCLYGSCDKKSGCVCDDGWTGESCDKDINECETTSGLCRGHNEVCKNTFGNYMCVCKDGFVKDPGGLCEDQDECTDKTSNNCPHICNNVPGSFYCSCRKGFLEENKQCIDIDECHGTHGCEYDCVNTLGNYRCSCPRGFNLDLTDRKSCIPAKACDENEGNCSEFADCFIEEDIPQCICRKGFTGDGVTCTDVEECEAVVSPCKHTCVEEEGGYHCECDDGFELGNDLASCKECAQGSFGANCEEECLCNATTTRYCNPVNGTCDCNAGWSGTNCERDIDECEQMTAVCPDISTCVNTNGSYSCKCDIGYLMTNEEVCEACDKRHFGENCVSRCTCNTTTTESCNKVNGTCKCIDGWKGDDCSVNINECDLNSASCSEKVNSVCKDTAGSYTCDCVNGYVEQSGTCVDINECLDKDTQIECPSTESRQCINEPGSYRCECRRGFSGDGVTCAVCTGNKYGQNCAETCQCDLNKVTDTSQSCDTGNGRCRCNDKWTGEFCQENVNECLDENLCSTIPNTGCLNVDDGYLCDCLVGFEKTPDENGSCSPKPSQKPVKGTTRPMTLTLDVNLPPGSNLEVLTTYESVQADAENSITNYLQPFIEGSFQVVVTGITVGSVIIDYVVVLEDEAADQGGLLEAVTELSLGRTMEFRNQTVGAKSEAFGNTTDRCELYETVLGECESGYRCVVRDDSPSCRKIPDNDTFVMTLGLSVGVSLLILMLVLLVVCARFATARKRKDRHRKKYKHAEPVNREPRRLNRTEISREEAKRFKQIRNVRQGRSASTVWRGTGSQQTVSHNDWEFYFGNKSRRPGFVDLEHSAEYPNQPFPSGQTGKDPSWKNMLTDEARRDGVSRFARPKLQKYEPKILQ